MNKIERLINLTAYLLDSRSPVTFEELRATVYKEQKGARLLALRRMFERDKEELRDMGVDVVTVPLADGADGYTIPLEQYYLPQLDLKPAERVALTMVSRLFLGSGTPFGGLAQSALLKFAFYEDDGGDPSEQVPHVHWVGTPRESEALASILEGLLRRKYLTFSYRALEAGEPIEREVEAYGLFNRQGFWYLVGRCHLRGEVRCFKVDRMVAGVAVNPAHPRTPDFEVPDGFDVRKEARWEWPSPWAEEDIEAAVRFAPRLAFAYASATAPVLASKRGRDGSLEVTYEVADPETFVDWVLEFGTDAVIVRPPELRQMARERLQGAMTAARSGQVKR